MSIYTFPLSKVNNSRVEDFRGVYLYLPLIEINNGRVEAFLGVYLYLPLIEG